MKRLVFSAFLLTAASWLTAAAQDPNKEADGLTVDSQWKGKLTQRGKIQGDREIPAAFEAVLVVTKRKGADFECELREKAGDATVTYHCKGKVTAGEKGAFKVEFDSVGVVISSEHFIAVERVPYRGAIAGKTMKGTWKVPLNKEDTELDGEFELQRQDGRGKKNEE
ncbi:MAG: hypothetical protein L0Y71_03985 [Gemmataceae bacterium]|nr:hypothetical protein [Gemmataceae bacterium]